MANQNITIQKGTDTTITIQVNGTNLADGGGTKTVTGSMQSIEDEQNATVVLVSDGFTVTATGDPSTFTWVPNSTVKALAKGLYSVVFIFTDVSGNTEKTKPYNKVFIESQT